MGQQPLTFLEKRWAAGYGSGNQLIQSAIQTTDRPNVAMLDFDVYRNVSTLGRRTLLSLGRFLFENCSPIRGAVLEMARLCGSVFLPQFKGKNKAWGQVAEALLEEEDNYIDIRGFPFSMDTFRRNMIVSLIRDGEFAVILADQNGEPKLQCIPSHRIGSRSMNSNVTTIVEGGPYDGAKLIDGCIVDDYGATMAYRVYDERGVKYDDISTNDMILAFIPDYVEQLRGYSTIGIHAFDASDVKDSRQWELIAQKIHASYTAVIKNETGFDDPTKSPFRPKNIANDSTTNAAADLPKKLIQPGQVMYIKAGTGQGIEIPSSDRPSPNIMAFQDEILRSIFHGMGWSFDFSHNPSKVGGAQMRVVVDKINASIAELQSLVLRPVCRRIYGWRVSKHINNKRLPSETEWYKWGFQGPPEITADEKYSSDVTIQEIRAGIRSPQNAVERFGGYWESVMDQSIEYEARLQAKCKSAGVDPNRIVLLTPNGNPVIQQPDQMSAP